jgi:four helix bundle protein
MDVVFDGDQLASQLPPGEKFGLLGQTTPAAVSIPSNIADGSAKTSKKEYKKYLETSLASAYEVETQILIIDRLNFGAKDLRDKLLNQLDEEQKMLMSFIRTVETS